MIGTGAKVDTRDVDRGLAAIADTNVLARTARALKKPMRVDQRDHAAQAEGPDGKWAPRKRLGSRGKKTAARNRRKLLGRLPRATAITAEGGTVSAVSRAKWSLVHQEGGRVGRGATLPARPFLWISEGLLTTAAAELQAAALGAWSR